MSQEVSTEKEPYAGVERRRHLRNRLTVSEQAVGIVAEKYKWQKLTDAEFSEEQFTEGDVTKKAVKALFDRLEGKLDADKVKKLGEDFDRGVDIWAQAGLFTPEREKAGYVKPDFGRDYQPLLTQEIMDMTEAGTDFNRGYGTPVFAPRDVPLHNEQAEKLSYFKLLKEALLKAFHGTAGGKQPNTLLVGPEKRVFTEEQVDLQNILWNWERYLKAGVVHDVKKLDPEEHGGVSEEQLLAQLSGVEKRTGGVMRLERNQLVMPSDVGETEMSALDWEAKLPDVLPPNASAQDIKQAVAHTIYCLETQGWIPDYYDFNSPKTSRVNLALKSYVPDEGSAGAVSALVLFVNIGQFDVDGNLADVQDCYGGVRGGVRIKES